MTWGRGGLPVLPPEQRGQEDDGDRDGVLENPTKSKWCVAKAAGGQKNVSTETPLVAVHDNKVGKYCLKDQHYVNVHRATYLENG